MAEAGYNGDGLRVKKSAAGETIVYHYDPAGNVISENHADGRKIADYVYLNGKLTARIDVNADLAEEVFFYHTDSAGTPLAMSDTWGQKVWEADYKPFGEEFTVDAARGNDKRFVGKEKDEETGLNYFGARYLSAKTGRFLAPDPVRAVGTSGGKVNASILAEPQRLNNFAYSMNNPYRFVDQHGLDPVPIFDVVVSQGFQGGGSFKIFGFGLEVNANFGRTETSLHGGDAVSESFSVALDLGKAAVGFHAERRASGHPILPQKDQLGRVIPYSGRSIDQMLRNVEWNIQFPVISSGPASANVEAGDWIIEGGIVYPLLPCVEGSVNISEISRQIDKENSQKPKTRIPLNGAL